MSIFVDKSLTFTNLITLLVEIAFGLIMVLLFERKDRLRSVFLYEALLPLRRS